MPNLFSKLTRLANSPQGKKLADKAQQFANDPKTKEQVEKAKLKLAEMRNGGGATTGETTPGAATDTTTGRPTDTTPGGTAAPVPDATPPAGDTDGPTKAA